MLLVTFDSFNFLRQPNLMVLVFWSEHCGNNQLYMGILAISGCWWMWSQDILSDRAPYTPPVIHLSLDSCISNWSFSSISWLLVGFLYYGSAFTCYQRGFPLLCSIVHISVDCLPAFFRWFVCQANLECRIFFEIIIHFVGWEVECTGQ